jgi:hypothetical protein
MPSFTQVGHGKYTTNKDGEGYLVLDVHLDGEPRKLLVYRDRPNETSGEPLYKVLSPHNRDRVDAEIRGSGFASTKKIGDHCDSCEAKPLLMYDSGTSATRDEPGQDEALFCPSCGAESKVESEVPF